jgi:hypothetical protein
VTSSRLNRDIELPPAVKAQESAISSIAIAYCHEVLDRSRFFCLLKASAIALPLSIFATTTNTQYYLSSTVLVTLYQYPLKSQTNTTLYRDSCTTAITVGIKSDNGIAKKHGIAIWDHIINPRL